MRKDQKTPYLLMKKSPKTYKPRLFHYCTTHEKLIQSCYLLLKRNLITKPNLLFEKKLANTMLRDCAHAYPNARIYYYSSNMILHVESDAAYLVMPLSLSCFFGHYHLSVYPTNPTNISYVEPYGPNITECWTLRHVVVSTSEYEIEGLFINVQKIVLIQTALIELDHLQPKTS